MINFDFLSFYPGCLKSITSIPHLLDRSIICILLLLITEYRCSFICFLINSGSAFYSLLCPMARSRLLLTLYYILHDYQNLLASHTIYSTTLNLLQVMLVSY